AQCLVVVNEPGGAHLRLIGKLRRRARAPRRHPVRTGTVKRERNQQRKDQFHEHSKLTHHASSNPVTRPLLLAKLSISAPIRCIMATKRLQSGEWGSRLKTICCPCRNPPPASRMGKLVLSWIFASPILLP